RRIAYISFEHPLGVSGGGIGTYLGQIARLMAERGNVVEVFTCHPQNNDDINYNGYILHRVQASSIVEFRYKVSAVFSQHHLLRPFDILEAAEYGAEALFIKKQFPDLSLAVKLHTPSYLTQLLNGDKAGLVDKVRFYLGGIIKGKIVKPYWVYRKEEDAEYQQYYLADAICSPSKNLSVLIQEQWPAKKEIAVIPNPFIPSGDFLSLPLSDYHGGPLVVSFFGRLERRKGILELMKAIPLVLQQNPKVVFRFIGKAHPSPTVGMDMEVYLKRQLLKWSGNLDFLGYQPYNKMSALLAQTHVCVFPSVWENFPNVCLEAMAAGRAVIASHNGGMAEMICEGKSGLLVPPKDPQAIADAILKIAARPSLLKELGMNARERVLNAYNETVIGDLVHSFYLKTLAQKKAVLA
ncbi:MAG: glycosyltransferase family 1 protein, partial [Chitinophagaceae bacterium]